MLCLLLLLLLLLRLLLLLMMVMMMTEMTDGDGELRMGQLIEMGTRRRRRRRLMRRMHMVIVTRLRILGMRRRQMMGMVMGTATVRQQTMHGSYTNGDTHCALLRDAISRNHSSRLDQQP